MQKFVIKIPSHVWRCTSDSGEKVLPLFKGPCGKKSCQEKNDVAEQKLEAGVLTITYQCKNGHTNIWHSSKVLSTKGGQKLFVSRTLLAAATLITGNNFQKINVFARCMNLSFIAASTFHRIQTFYVIPNKTSRNYEVKWKEKFRIFLKGSFGFVWWWANGLPWL